MPNQAGPTNGEQARQLALAQLRQAILRGEMAPAQRLVENELAEQFDVTRAGVRAALIELESEGLVERIRNRGARVRVVSVEEAVAITECRMVLEGLCAAKAAVAADDEQLDRLSAIGARPGPGVLPTADGRVTSGAAQRPVGTPPVPARAEARTSPAVPE
jgi:DNA-binding GntR family transcriptional regulator